MNREKEGSVIELRRSPRIHRQPVIQRIVDPGTQLQAIGAVFPWNSALIALVSAIVTTRIVDAEFGIGMALCVLLFLGVLEAMSSRDWVEPPYIVRRRGLFGWWRQRIPLSRIDRVEVTYPGRTRAEGLGNISVWTGETCHSFVALEDPESVASRIRDLVAAAKAGAVA